MHPKGKGQCAMLAASGNAGYAASRQTPDLKMIEKKDVKLKKNSHFELLPQLLQY